MFGCELSAGHACPYAVHVDWVEFEGVVEALGLDGALLADGSGVLDVGDVFVAFGEHFVGASSAVCFCLPALLLPPWCCLYIVSGVVVLLVHFVVFLVCWMWVWYGCPVLGSYLAAVAMALRACFLACDGLRGVGSTVSAPSA